MKIDEIVFFRLCAYVDNATDPECSIQEIMNMLDGVIPYKRMVYYLKKWAALGFYNYGVSLDMGWFETYGMPDRYKLLYYARLGENSKALMEVVNRL